MRTVYRCLACGSDINVVEEFEPALTPASASDTTLRSTSTLDHVGPTDAACQLVVETLIDEIQTITRRIVEGIKADVFRPKS